MPVEKSSRIHAKDVDVTIHAVNPVFQCREDVNAGSFLGMVVHAANARTWTSVPGFALFRHNFD